LGVYVSQGYDNTELITECIVKIARAYKATEKKVLKEIILFDTLNAIFRKQNAKGVSSLIYKIYKALAEILYTDEHFWIQRSKSIYILKRDEKDELKEASEYATTAASIAKNDASKQKANLMAAMIMGRICNIDRYEDEAFLRKTVFKYHEAFTDSSHNAKAVGELIARARKPRNDDDLRSLANYLLQHPELALQDVSIKEPASYLIREALNKRWFEY
jgi:hypothetical protein